MNYPNETGEAEPFVPASLKHLESPPTFWLRQGTMREKSRQRRLQDEEGLTLHDATMQREELLNGMKELLGSDYALWQPRAKQWWDAQDAFAAEWKDSPVSEVPEFTFEGSAAIIEVLEQIARDWRPYRLMMADNREANRMLPEIVNSVIIEKFEGLDVKPQFYGKYLTLDCAMEISEALDRMASDAGVPDDALRPLLELRGECMLKLYLGKEREKNSASPSPSDPTPPASKAGKASVAGKSKASARSKKTRAVS